MDSNVAAAMARAERLAQQAQGQGQGVVEEHGEGWRSYSRQGSFEGSGAGR